MLYKMRPWLFYYHKNLLSEKVRWMGVHVIKTPLDAWIFQEIIWDVKPECIVEIGSADGGSTLFFAHILDILGKGMVPRV